jgi:DNA recombination protein RmuC
MTESLPFIALVLGLALAALIGWLLWGRPLGTVRGELGQLRDLSAGQAEELGRRREAEARLAAEREQLAARVATLELEARRGTELAAELAGLQATQAERDRAHAAELARLREEFQRLAGEALDRAQARFAEQAAETLKAHRAEAERGLEANRTALSELVSPVKDVLGRYGEELKAIEAKREQAYGSLGEQLQALSRSEAAVREEAGRIVAALRGSARASGSWGEAQLRRVLEVAGLAEGIDFAVQASSADDDGRQKRPDAIINLPGGRQLIIDSKCALDDHMAAIEAPDDTARLAARRRHAARVRAHAAQLATKAYWDANGAAADFVLMFLPGENFLSAALEEDAELHLWAMNRRVLLAGPTQLLAIARVVAMVWRQDKLAEEARTIGELGATLYERLVKMTEHMNKVGRNLDDAAKAWNDFAGSVEHRVLATGRKLAELGANRKGAALPEPRLAETTLRLVQPDARDGS